MAALVCLMYVLGNGLSVWVCDADKKEITYTRFQISILAFFIIISNN